MILGIESTAHTFSMGIADITDCKPQFGIGGNYNILENFNVSFDYMINQLLVATPDQLRLSLTASF